MAEDKAVPVVDFDKRMKEERKFYLGYSDTVPGTGQPIAEARKEYQEKVAKENARMEERRRSVLAKNKITPGSIVTSAGDGEIVEIKSKPLSETASVASPITVDDEAPKTITAEDLQKMTKAELVTHAAEAHSRELPDTLTKEEMVNLILTDMG